MKNLYHKNISGLTPLKKDARDLSLGAVYKTIPIKDIPLLDFVVSQPIQIKDQLNTDMCVAYAITAVSEDQEGIELSPEYQFAQTKKILGDITSWGADLRTACKAIEKIGSIPNKQGIAYMNGKGVSKYNRDWIADWKNWDSALDMSAIEYKKKTYLSIDSTDLFSAIIEAMWTFKDEKRSILTGTTWYGNYTDIPLGIIPLTPQGAGFGHAFKIFGQKIINKERYLVAQLSNGTSIGDGGLFYFPKEVVNRDFKFGAFMFQDVDTQIIRDAQASGTKLNEVWYNKLLIIIKNVYEWFTN